MAAQSIQSFIGDLKQYKKNVLDVRQNAEIAALTELSSQMQTRIFSKNEGTDGQSFGSYRSEAYKKKRENFKTEKGRSSSRQTAIKDLELTGAFRRSIKVGKNNGINVLGFDDSENPNKTKSYLIREGQEKGSRSRNGSFVKQIGFDIFVPRDEEIDRAFEKYLEVIDDKLRELNNV